MTHNDEEDSENSILKIEIPPNISDALELFAVFSAQAKFPEYFGVNWNALVDCLSDLSWISENHIIVHHSDFPFEPDSQQRATYLGVLADVSERYADYSRMVRELDNIYQDKSRLKKFSIIFDSE